MCEVNKRLITGHRRIDPYPAYLSALEYVDYSNVCYLRVRMTAIMLYGSAISIDEILDASPTLTQALPGRGPIRLAKNLSASGLSQILSDVFSKLLGPRTCVNTGGPVGLYFQHRNISPVSRLGHASLDSNGPYGSVDHMLFRSQSRRPLRRLVAACTID